MRAPRSAAIPTFLRQVLSLQGEAAANAANLAEGQDVVVNALKQRINEASGVNVDQEMANLIALQTAYGANARVMSAVKEMLDILMNLRSAMSVSDIGGTAAGSMLAIVDMRARLDDLQRQLGTGKKSDSYAGLGLDRGLTIGLRSQLSAISGYQDTITQVGVRLDLMQTALTQFDTVAQKSKSAILLSQFALNGGTQTQDQVNVGQLDQLVGLLNTGADGRYLFSGRSVDRPVDSHRPDHRTATACAPASSRSSANAGRPTSARAASAGSGWALRRRRSRSPRTRSPFGFKLVGASSNHRGRP